MSYFSPGLVLLAVFLVYEFWYKPKERRLEQVNRAKGYVAAVAVELGGIHTGDVYSILDGMVESCKRNKRDLPDFPILALDALTKYAAKTDYTRLAEYCEQHRRDASRFSVSFDLVP